MRNEACAEFEIIVDRLDRDFAELKKRASESGIPYDIVELGYYNRNTGKGFVKLQTSTHSDAILLRNALNAVYSGLGKGIYTCKGFSQDRASVLEKLRKTAIEEGFPEALAARAYRILRNEGLLDRFESPEGDPDIFSYRIAHSKGCGNMTHHLIMKAYRGTRKDDVLDEFDSMASDMGIAENEAKCVRTLLVKSNHLRSLIRNPNLKAEQVNKLLLNCKGVGPSRSALLSRLRSRYLSKNNGRGRCVMHSEPITDVNEYLRTRYSEKAGRWDDCVHTKALCQDGYSVSIQASSFHYCIPRVTGARHYDAVELGYPSERDPIIEGYRQYGIYLFVPSDLVNQLLEKHGGIVYWE